MTIKDIVKLSGYSLGTVSRVINGHPNVSDKARKHILAIMEEHNFQPNESAKLLKQQSSPSYAIIVRGTQNMLFANLIEKIQQLLVERGETAAIVNYLDEYDNEVQKAIEFCKQRYPKGLIFLGGNLDHFKDSFQEIKVPSILLTNHASDLPFENLSSFSTDDVEASKEAIELLIENGHTEIGLIGGNLHSSQISLRRVQGCMRAFHEKDILFNLYHQHEPCRYALEDSYKATKNLLERCPNTTAIFALSDITAFGAMRAISDLGKTVPHDISIIGFDGILLSMYSCPRITTICQQTDLLAEKGINELMLMQKTMENKEKYTPIHEYLTHAIRKGESIKTI